MTQRSDGCERHRATPGSSIVAGVLRSVSCQKHPAFTKSDTPIKLDQIISILTLEIAGGTNHQDKPALSWIEVCRRGQHGDCVWRYNISSLSGQRFFLRAEGNISLDR